MVEVILWRYTFLVAQLCIETGESTKNSIGLEADELLEAFSQGCFFSFLCPCNQNLWLSRLLEIIARKGTSTGKVYRNADLSQNGPLLAHIPAFRTYM